MSNAKPEVTISTIACPDGVKLVEMKGKLLQIEVTRFKQPDGSVQSKYRCLSQTSDKAVFKFDLTLLMPLSKLSNEKQLRAYNDLLATVKRVTKGSTTPCDRQRDTIQTQSSGEPITLRKVNIPIKMYSDPNDITRIRAATFEPIEVEAFEKRMKARQDAANNPGIDTKQRNRLQKKRPEERRQNKRRLPLS